MNYSTRSSCNRVACLVLCLVASLFVGLAVEAADKAPRLDQARPRTNPPARPANPGGRRTPPTQPTGGRPETSQTAAGATGQQAVVQRIKGRDAAVPLLAILAKRHRINPADRNDLDRTFARLLQRSPRVRDFLLPTFLEAYDRLPADLKQQKLVLRDQDKADPSAVTPQLIQQMRHIAHPETAAPLAERVRRRRREALGDKIPIWPQQVFGSGEVTAQSVVPKPVINGIGPDKQSPGRTINIAGKNFQTGKEHKIILTEAGPGRVEQESYTATAISRTKLSFELPDHLLPGRYEVCVQAPGRMIAKPGLPGLPVSAPFEYEVGAPRYQITFRKMKCVDETRTEAKEPGWQDSLVTFWVISADEKAWLKHSRRYKPFADGTETAYDDDDRKVLTPSGGHQPVANALTVVVDLYEWNWQDVDSGDSDEVLQFSYSFAEATGLDFPLISDMISIIVHGCSQPPHYIGRDTIQWQAHDLQMTIPSGGKIGRSLDFKGRDGHYRLYYSLSRN